MFLRNFDNTVVALMGANMLEISDSKISNLTLPYGDTFTSFNVGSAFEDGRINQKCTNGTIGRIYVDYGSGYSYYIYAPASASAQAICLGDGNSPVAYDDYKLSGTVLNSSFSLVSQEVVTSFSTDYKTMYKDLTIIITNTSAELKTIKEWGLWRYSNKNSTSIIWGEYNNNSVNYVLTFREVLSTPVTVESGGSAKLTLRIAYPLPNHP